MTLPDFLTRTDRGTIRLTGHRIDLAHVVPRYLNGETPAEIAAAYPPLAPALVADVIGFYEANRAAVDGYLRAQDEAYARLAAAPPPGGPSVADLRRRAAARPAESA